MARYKVILAYDGTEFQGFQRQSEGRTVQGSVEEGLRSLGWQGSALLAAGRTDAGVHALGQVIAFDLDWKHSPEDLANALNANLSADISARGAEIVEESFHPRYSAVTRRYQYRLFTDPLRQPVRERFAWRVWPPVALEPMNQVANRLIGTYDFSVFGTPLHPGGSTIRRIFSASWRNGEDDFLFEIVGNAFLYHMVRRLVFFQVEVGQGKRKSEQIEEMLNNSSIEKTQGLAPANGLMLTEVEYVLDRSDKLKN
jgi:tRNA pseudouridine38-40 synthase